MIFVFIIAIWAHGTHAIVSSSWTCCDEALLHKDAQSAIQRAQSPECQAKIKEIACLQNDDLYPAELKSQCDFYDKVAYLGCFRDNSNKRIFNSSKLETPKSMSPHQCVKYCLQRKFALAGVQEGLRCVCGNTVSQKLRIDEENCNMDCPGDEERKCGGKLAMNIYKTKTHESHPKTKSKIRLAYLFMVHGRSIRQVKRLFYRLYNPDDFIYIHIDSRSQYMYDHLKPLEVGHSNVIVTETRFASIWGGVSMLDMMISSMREMLELEWDMDFIIDVSGTDYLLKTPEELKTFLSEHVGMNFVQAFEALQNRNTYYNHTYIECNNYMYQIGTRTVPKGIQYYKGSQFFCISRNFAEYIAYPATNDTLLQGLYSVYNHTIVPEERFFATALQNSKFCSTHYISNVHMINWEKGCHCHRPSADFCGCSPLTLTQKRMDFINTARNHDATFFGRKFDATVDMSVLNTLDKYLYGVDVPNKYWINIWHHKYDAENAFSTLASSLIGDQKSSATTIQELTLFYENNEQDSLLVLFTDEMEIQREHRYLTKQSSIETESGYIISIGNQFDYTNKMHTQTLPIFDTKPSLLIKKKSEMKIEENQTASVFWISPHYKVTGVQRNLTREYLTKEPRLLTYPHESPSQGLWTVVFVDFKQKFYSLEYLVSNSKDDQEDEKAARLSKHEIDVLKANWRLKSSIQSWIGSYFVFNESCVSGKSCEANAWSSKSYDFSIDLKKSC